MSSLWKAPISAPTTPPPLNNDPSKETDIYDRALHNNWTWAHQTTATAPTFFSELAVKQSPTILWLGCSDSRVPAETICGLAPGDMFVHRNIANLVHGTDLSSAAVIEYAVKHLRVKHVVLCGHVGCGGVAAALGNDSLGVLDLWLNPLREIRAGLKAELDACGSKEERALRLVVENVRVGVGRLRNMACVIDGSRGWGLQVHGLVYDIGTGRLKTLDVGEGADEVKTREECFGLNKTTPK